MSIANLSLVAALAVFGCSVPVEASSDDESPVLTEATLAGSRAGRFEVLFTYAGTPTEIPDATTCEGCKARYAYPYDGLVLLAITAQGPWTASPVPRRPDSIRELSSTEEWVSE